MHADEAKKVRTFDEWVKFYRERQAYADFIRRLADKLRSQ